MSRKVFYAPTNNAAISSAINHLQCAGCTFSDSPDNITHLLLPIPSLSPDGTIRGGGDFSQVLSESPKDICIIGGNLPPLTDYRVYDLLKDPGYLAENAYITAHCAVRMLLNKLPTALRGCRILVIGWGRIGKCLAALLKGLEADVTVAARKESDRAMIQALGYHAADTAQLDCYGFRVIFNTVPAPVLPDSPAECLKIDLASVQGICGNDVIHARGLPGKDAPEASGELIARTVLRLLSKEDRL